MNWISTEVKYHTQNESHFCGPACAMMVLAEIGVAHSQLSQQDLYDLIQNKNNDPNMWGTDPEGLKVTLMAKKGAFPNTFAVFEPETEPAGTQRIVDTLLRYRVSPIALISNYGDGEGDEGVPHWVVVKGFQTDVDLEADPTQPYQLVGLWIHNPVFLDNRPHRGADTCGTAGWDCGAGNQYGTDQFTLYYSDWQTNYFIGCDQFSLGTDKFISVCDPRSGRPQVQPPKPLEVRAPVGRDGKAPNGNKIIEPEDLSSLIDQGLQANGLDLNEKLRPVIEATRGRPVLVKRLDRVDTFYYLVPALDGQRVIGYFQLDARFGLLQSIFLFQRGEGGGVAQLPSADEIQERVSGETFERAGSDPSFRLYDKTFCVPPCLTWRPCLESWSPHLPFWQLTSGRDTLYLRVDGEAFTRLTTRGVGF